MQDSAKYLVHADITAEGVVERNDVVGAVFGQTEGLLGDELEIRDLQESSKVGRIDVEIRSENGQSFGELTIATSLDKVETAILAAALETIERVGPCRSTISVRTIEDVRAAKRREVVDRAKRLLAESFDGSVMSSDELIEQVRQSVRVENITKYEGYPAGPRVADSDAIIVVEGRADVLQLLKYGVKNAVAVEGTNVPESIADLTRERTVTAFLDGDRGGDLILKELDQVGDIDFVAFAPPNRSVEDLERHEVMAALRDKVAYDAAVADDSPRSPNATGEGATERTAEGDGGTAVRNPTGSSTGGDAAPEPAVRRATDAATGVDTGAGAAEDSEDAAEDSGTNGNRGTTDTEADADVDADAEADDDGDDGNGASEAAEEGTADREPETLGGHVRQVIEEGTSIVRLLDDGFATLSEGEAESAFDLLVDADPVPTVVVLDGRLEQRVLDVCAQRGVEQVVTREEGEFVKRPASVRIRTAERLLRPAETG
jgi:DNA primase